MTNKYKKIFVSATEQSGDNIGYNIISELLKSNPKIIFDGVGGNKMAPFLQKQFFSLNDFHSIGIVEIIFSIKKFINIIKFLYNKILTNHYDLIIDNQSISYGMLEIQKRIPFIEIIHHPITYDFKHELEASNKIKYKISRYRWYSFLKMQKKVAPRINRIITPSKSSKKGIIQDFKCLEKNITVINNGLDASEFAPIETSKRNQFRLITTASADVPLKGLDFSLKALKNLMTDFPEVHLIVIGKIKENGHTQRLIEKLKIQESVFFKSNITKSEITNLYSTSSVAIVSSLYEGFGYPVIEAMSCGVPLIATNVSSIPELTKEFAILVDPKDHQMIADSVKKVFINYDKYKEIAINGREHVKDNFNWDKITKEYENVISKTIKEFKNADI